jgi:hypothetical protein
LVLSFVSVGVGFDDAHDALLIVSTSSRVRSILRITDSVSSGNAMIGELVVVVVSSVLATGAAAFESQIWPGSLPSASATITVKSPVTVEGWGDTVGGWVLINYALSVDCSPPRACYASSQWVYSYAYCSTRAIREMQRTSLDLNGNVVAETGERVIYIPPRGSVDRAVVRTLCETYGFPSRQPWLGRDRNPATDD